MKAKIRARQSPHPPGVRPPAADLERQVLEARAALAEAEENGRMKDRLLSHAAHELRTPLASMMVWLGVLRQGRPGDIQAALAAIEESARSQARLIEELVDIGRALGGRLHVDSRPLDPRGPVRAAVEGVRPDAETRGISLQGPLTDGVDAQPEVGLIHGDPRRLEQIVSQLLLHAIKNAPAGGQINLVMARAGAAVRIDVQDRGQEFDPEMLGHFFFKATAPAAGSERTSPRRPRGGTTRGFGLALVEQLVQLQGGRIGVESLGAGLGMTFAVHLPAVATTPPRQAPTGRKGARRAPTRVSPR